MKYYEEHKLWYFDCVRETAPRAHLSDVVFNIYNEELNLYKALENEPKPSTINKTPEVPAVREKTYQDKNTKKIGWATKTAESGRQARKSPMSAGHEKKIKHEKKEKTVKEVSDRALTPININDAHELYGHISEDILRRTLPIYGYKAIGTMVPCPVCMMYKGKQKGVPKSTKLIATKPGERLHIDLSTLPHLTVGGSKHWVKLKDQFSGMSWNVFVTRKSQVPDVLRRKLKFFKGAGIKIENLRCDNAGEHQTQFQQVCEEEGVKLEYTAPNTPQQNGVVERQFATELRRANAMLAAASFNERTKDLLRAEAITTSCILDNTVCNERGQSKYELFFGRKPNLLPKSMIEFGRIGYVTDRRKIKGKMRPKSNPYVMVGYALNHSIDTYRMYNPMTRAVIMTRDIQWGPSRPKFDPRDAMGMFDMKKIDTSKAYIESRGQSAVQHKAPSTNSKQNEVDDYSSDDSDGEQDLDEELDREEDAGILSNKSQAAFKKLLEQYAEDEPALQYPEVSDDDSEDSNEEVKKRRRRVHRTDPEDEEDEWVMTRNDEQEGLPAMIEPDDYDNQPTPGNNNPGGTRPGGRLGRELRGLGVTTIPAVRNLHTNYNPTMGQVYSAITSDPGEPTTFNQAIKGLDRVKWMDATRKEIKNFLDRKVWKKVPREQVMKQHNRKLIGTKWVYKKKVEQDNTIRYKA